METSKLYFSSPHSVSAGCDHNGLLLDHDHWNHIDSTTHVLQDVCSFWFQPERGRIHGGGEMEYTSLRVDKDGINRVCS